MAGLPLEDHVIVTVPVPPLVVALHVTGLPAVPLLGQVTLMTKPCDCTLIVI